MQETINTMIEDENSHYIEVFNDHDVENKLKRESLLKKKKGKKSRPYPSLPWKIWLSRKSLPILFSK